MIALIFFSLFALLVLCVLWMAARGMHRGRASLDDLPRLAQPVDLEAFLNLVDPAEEMYLRAHLPADDFVEIRRERLHAVLEYLGRCRHNAAVLLRVGEAAQASPDPAIAVAGADLVAAALTFRLYSMLLPLKIYPGLVFAGMSLSLAPFGRRYERVKSTFESLSRLQAPAEAGRLAAAI
ncbi:MAG: hypothetical protein E6G79_02850 [Alphaproteobacteria bacterium]|nr:MAG: hypothetical protein E6G79_02850 [Alphaproteobacteria bacterium]